MQQKLKTKTNDLSNELVANQAKNKIVVIGMSLMNVILAVSYFIEVLKGERKMAEYLIVFLLTILPTVLIILTYFKNKASKSVCYISTLFFIVFYTYVMLTTTKMIVFCYVIVLITLMMVYGKLSLTLICSISGLIINIASVLKLALTTELSPAFITEIEIAIACILLVSFYSIMVSKLNEQINSNRLQNLNQEKQQTVDLLQTVLEVTDSMNQNIHILTDETNKLNISINDTKESMEDLAVGAEQTAEAITTQQAKTTEIQADIITLEKVADQIIHHVKTSEQIVSGSQQTMDQLLEQVNNSEKAGHYVAKQMEELKTYTEQMQDILTLINNVASQTGMLSLNANIEAARAGESGKGFVVVATEISNLSNQTKNATLDIHKLIEEISHSMEEVINSITNLLQSNQIQTKYINNTAVEFSEIQSAIQQIYEGSDQLSSVVRTVLNANETITNSIQNVSASTQEITAKASETLDSTITDKESVEKVLAAVEQLKKYAKDLNSNQ